MNSKEDTNYNWPFIGSAILYAFIFLEYKHLNITYVNLMNGSLCLIFILITIMVHKKSKFFYFSGLLITLVEIVLSVVGIIGLQNISETGRITGYMWFIPRIILAFLMFKNFKAFNNSISPSDSHEIIDDFQTNHN